MSQNVVYYFTVLSWQGISTKFHFLFRFVENSRCGLKIQQLMGFGSAQKILLVGTFEFLAY